MKWTRPLVVTGRVPTEQERDLAMVDGRSRWVRWTMYNRSVMVDGVEWRPGDVTSWGDHIVRADGAPDPGATWRAINPDTSPVMVECTREEALEAAGWRRRPADEVIEAWPLWHVAVLYPSSYRLLDVCIFEYTPDLLRWVGDEYRWRPLGPEFNYDPRGWPDV